ncbi:MAG: diguanylate cyclase [Lachnospiraceae bacterium]|nr:diguanylate cyclase [Lachnospiraceae bacterium]
MHGMKRWKNSCQRQWSDLVKRERGSSSIRRKVFTSVIVMVLLQIGLLAGFLFWGGILERLNQNALDIVKEKVISRRNYLEDYMTKRWSNLTLTEKELNKIGEQIKAGQGKDFEQIGSKKNLYQQYLKEACPLLVQLMRQNSVTGAFVILNTGELDFSVPEDKKGIYLRDYEPTSQFSDSNKDILIERMPRSLIEGSGLALDSGWSQDYMFSQSEVYGDYFYKPYQAALDHPEMSTSDLGYWSKGYQLNGDNTQVISYSIPLRLEDGTVYGVLGIEITESYLKKIVPVRELNEESGGSYVIGVEEEEGLFDPAVENGSIVQRAWHNQDGLLIPQKSENYKGFYDYGDRDEEKYSSIMYMSLYNTNTPFVNEKWALIGTVRGSDLFAFSHSIFHKMILAVVIVFLISIAGAAFVSVRIAWPIRELAIAVAKGRTNQDMLLEFKKTGIREVDELGESIESLTKALLESSKKFADILSMASVDLGGFEYDREKESLFLTDGFFRLFCMDTEQGAMVSMEEFVEKMEETKKYIYKSDAKSGNYLYRIPTASGDCWIRMNIHENKEKIIGLAEDVTKDTMELRKVEQERDYDILTNLLNRRAFAFQMEEILNQGDEVLKEAAMIMIDLDNLKWINDTYGHEFGDLYIQRAAKAFQEILPMRSIAARRSGDEFTLFYYGYESREELSKQIDRLKNYLCGASIMLPGNKETFLKMSGGIAYYPDKGKTVEELFRAADTAMYYSKKSGKNRFTSF